MEGDLNCVWAPGRVGRLSLKVPAGDLDMAEGGEHCVGNVVDGNAVDGDEHVLRLFTKWPGEI